MENYGLFDVDSNSDNEEVDESSKYNIFNPKLFKKNVLVDTFNMDTLSNPVTIDFQTSEFIHREQTHNELFTSSFSNYSNIIGFKLIKAIIPFNYKNIHKNNNKLIYSNSSSNKIITFTIPIGNYTESEIVTTFTDTANYQTNDPAGILVQDKITVTYNSNTCKFSFQNISNDLLLNMDTSTMLHLLGIVNLSSFTITSSSIEAPRSKILNPTYIDIIIEELPHIICKDNIKGNRIFSRIPINYGENSIIYYENPDQKDIYFFPININKLTISLMDEFNQYFQNDPNYFSLEFEITMYHKFDDLI